ncbi:MAG: cysteine desulfurase [Methylotenera sp.]|nr:cysteine desulfurase [Oligoflexia bacterium]
MKSYLFFDNAATTRCCEAAAEHLKTFALQDFGNPSSSHIFGQTASRAIKKARNYFAQLFNTRPEQIIFTGSGSEADNLAVYGVAMDALAKRTAGIKAGKLDSSSPFPRVICSATEHPAVRKTVQSLQALGFDVQLAPVDEQGQLLQKNYLELLTSETVLVSIHRVNNIVGTILPVEELAQIAKQQVPGVIFHTDAVQAFGRVDVPTSPSAVDLVSVSAHKIHGPKGVGALIILNPSLLKEGFRPLIWGGDQEGGFRSGTQSAGLISGFHAAAEHTFSKREAYTQHMHSLKTRFRKGLHARKLNEKTQWNSPEHPGHCVPHIISLSVPHYPSSMVAQLLEERGCLVSTGSACSSAKAEPDPVLKAMGVAPAAYQSAIRISFSSCNELKDVETLLNALDESIAFMDRLLSGKA